VRERRPASLAESRGSQLLGDPAFVGGARSLLFDYLRLARGGNAVFVFDPKVRDVCSAIGAVAVRAGIIVRTVSAKRKWPAIRSHLEEQCDAALFLESGESHHTVALKRHLTDSEDAAPAYRLFGATAEAIRGGFRRRRDVLSRRNWDLIGAARRAGRLVVQSDSGTCLEVGLDRAAPWANTYGECADGFPGVLPPSEVNTRSADVDGVLVADGAIGSNVGWPLDARLAGNPVRLRVSRGKVIGVDCRHRLVRGLVEEFLSVPQTNEVVEIGIGTNDGIPGFVPSDILLNERYASFHLGVGSADARKPSQNLHMDFILGDCRIFLGDHLALARGRFRRPRTAAIPDRRRYGVAINLHDAL
jgi:hypothetical protein